MKKTITSKRTIKSFSQQDGVFFYMVLELTPYCDYKSKNAYFSEKASFNLPIDKLHFLHGSLFSGSRESLIFTVI